MVSRVTLKCLCIITFNRLLTPWEDASRKIGRFPGTTVALSSSMWVISHSNPSQVPSLHMHVRSDRLHAGCQEIGMCSIRGGSWGMYITFASAKSNPEETSPEIQNRVTNGPKKRTCVRQKLLKKGEKFQKPGNQHIQKKNMDQGTWA